MKLTIRNTLVPWLWCFVCLCVLAFLLVTRSRCHRLIARALRLDTSHEVDSLVLDLPWWLGPPPARPGELVIVEQFRTAVGWPARNSLSTLLRYVVFFLFTCVFVFTLYVSWRSTILVEQEMRFNRHAEKSLSGLSLYQIEPFVIRECSILVIVFGSILVFSWFRPRAVPDHKNEDMIDHKGRERRIIIQAALLGLGIALFPFTNLAKSILAKPVKHPR